MMRSRSHRRPSWTPHGSATTLPAVTVETVCELGVSLTHYRNRVRVARALDRLEAGKPSLATLAADLSSPTRPHLTPQENIAALSADFALAHIR